MKKRVLALFLALMGWSVCAHADFSELPNGLGVVLSTTSGERVGTLAGGGVVEVHVVTDNIELHPLDGIQAAQFGVTVDPRLQVLGRTPNSNAFFVQNPTADEWILGFLNCVNPSASPFTLVTYLVQLPAGATDVDDLRINVGPVASIGEPMLYGRCNNPADLLRFAPAGGVTLNATLPAAVHVSSSVDVHVEGRNLELAWETSGASSATLQGAPVALVGNSTDSPLSDTVYEIVASNGSDSNAAQVLVEVIREPRVESFTVDLVDGSARLAWDVRGATTIAVDAVSGVGQVAFGGALVPIDRLSWELRATNEWGTTSLVAAIEVNENEPPLIAVFDALPDNFVFGQAVTLRYVVLNVDTAQIDNGVGSLDVGVDTVVVNPSTSTSYTLSATNGFGTSMATVNVTLAPTTVTLFEANPDVVYGGFPTTLQWSVSSADPSSIGITPDVGPVPPDGSVQVTPTASPTTYTLSASNAETSTSATTTVTWKVPDATLAVSNAQPYPQNAVTITADIQGAQSANLQPGFGTIAAAGGEFVVFVTEPTTFVLECTNAAGTTTRTVDVTPLAPTINSFAPDVTPIAAGTSAVLSWDLIGSDSATVQPVGYTSSSPSDQLVVNPSETTEYTLVATNAAGTSTASTTIEVVPLIIESFTASPQLLGAGQSSTLSWVVLGSGTVSIDGEGAQPSEGSLVVSPTESRTYTLRATTGAFEITAEVQVIVVEDADATIALSWSPDEFPGVRPNLQPFFIFDWYVVVFGVPGFEVYEVRVEVDPCVVVAGISLNPPNALNVAFAPGDFIVGLGSCVSGDFVEVIRHTALIITPDPACVAEGVISLGAPTPSSFNPPVPGWVDCESPSNLNPFNIGPPLTFSDTTPVPVVSFSLEARPHPNGVEVTWEVPAGVLPSEINIYRNVGNGAMEMAVSVPGSSGRSSWVDSTAPLGQDLRYQLVARVGGIEMSSESVVFRSGQISARRSGLLANWPNPFNPSTDLRFVLAEPGEARLRVVDLSGRLVRTFGLPGLSAGEHSVTWHGTDDRGQTVASGVYVVEFESGSVRDARRITLLK